jgi:P27 family predicted phage terminase small subunit
MEATEASVRGRKPKPTVLKLLNGNPGKRPINKAEPKPEPLATDCPDELSSDDAKSEWERTIIPAIHRGQITSADRVFAIAHCELWATWRSQLSDAARHAHVVAVGKNSHPTPNPARGMANKTFLLLAKVDAELGLTPASRSRVQVTGKDHVEADKWAGIL